MKAIVCHNYGSPDVLRCEEVGKPTPADGEVLIKVRAASVNPLDWHLMRGTPLIGRLAFGLRRPKVTRPGVDVAGEVEVVGSGVTEFKPGDAVFGSCRGAFAEYVCAPESKLVLKPKCITFEQAAAVPVAAYTVLQGFGDAGKLQPGQKVLINGAAGGVGTLAVQIAKSMGADVTAICSTRNADMVRSIGADRVIDYTREDFTKGNQRYDLIFDLVANHSLLTCRRALSPKGIYIGAGVLGASLTRLPVRLIAASILAVFVSQKFVTLFAKSRKEDLEVMCDLMESGKVIPVVDRSYRLSEGAEAVRYLAEKHARGKVVITPEWPIATNKTASAL